MPSDVFISYSSADKPTADAACAVLERAGVRCWIAPRDIGPGEEWGSAILEALEHCRVLVLIFSSHANKSNHIHRELERAVNFGVTVIPVRIESVDPTKAVSYFVSSVHWLDALTPPLEAHLETLAASIGRLLALPPREVAPGAEKSSEGTATSRQGKNPRAGILGRRNIAIAVAVVLAIMAGLGALAYRVVSPSPTPTPLPTSESAVAAAPSPNASPVALPPPSANPAVPDVRRFDGSWIGTLVCNSTLSGLPGWSYELDAVVLDGAFRAERGDKDKPGSEAYEGTIKPDGAAEISQNGLSGETSRDPFHRPTGTEFHNTYLGKFDQTHGTLTRLNRASCTMNFAFQSAH
jgi:hypothetical protein